MFQLDLKSRKSIYLQIVDGFKELIVSGIMPAGSRLPSVRELSMQLTCNPNTIQKAYRELEHQGFVYSSPGLGTFVSERDTRRIDERALGEIREQLRRSMRELSYLGLGRDEVEAELRAVLNETEGSGIFTKGGIGR